MNESSFYEKFSQDYDRFVNWDSRLASEITFLLSKLNFQGLKGNEKHLILDVACGTGHHAITLAKHGLNCVGVDNSIGMIKIAKENALNQNVKVDFKIAGFGDLEDIFKREKFDGLLCLGNSLPHVLNKKNLEKTLSDFRSVLNVDGILIIQNLNFDKILGEKLRWMSPQTYQKEENIWIFSRFFDFVGDNRITFNIQILTSKEGEDFSQEVISTTLMPIKKKSLGKMLMRTGFRSLQYFGDLQGSVFNLDTSPNLVVVAKAG